MANKFYTSLKKAQDEVSEVQPLYRAEVEYALGHSGWHEYEEKDAQGNPRRKPLVKVDGLAHIGRTDGIIKASYLDTEQDYAHATYIDFYTLLECKLNQSFREDRVRAEVLLQVVCYLKQMQDNGDVLPKAVIIGSKVDCFAVGINALSKYAAMDITGYKSASTAYKYNTAIMQEMLKDEVLLEQCLIFDINTDFDMQSIAERVVKLAKGINLRLSLDVRSVAKAFDYFTMYVLKNTSKMDIRKQQELFLKLLLDAKDNDYVLNNDRIYVAGERVDVDGRAFRTFQATYKVTEPYTSDEERAITATADRLIEDADRRRKGDFYTPTVWVDEAHKMLTEQLGADWREKYVVWDCACYSMDTEIFIRRAGEEKWVFFDDFNQEMDEVLTLNPETLEKSWGKVLSKIDKMVNALDMFEIETSALLPYRLEDAVTGRIKVTSDHKVLVYITREEIVEPYVVPVEQTCYMVMTARELCELYAAEKAKGDKEYPHIVKFEIPYIRNRGTKFEHIAFVPITNINRVVLCDYAKDICKKIYSDTERVWCLTTESEHHNFYVRRGALEFFCGNCGTKNLTRDYGFKELYSSTLIEGDLALSSKYNVSGTPRNELGCAFQYDFLNDDVDEFEALAEIKKIKGTITLDDIKAANFKLYAKAPGLLESLCAGKKLLFFINPPYAANGEISCTIGQNKTGVGESAINRLMGARKMGKGARQLYAQFIYRICLLKNLFATNMCIGMFTPTLLFTGEYCNKLRELMSDCSLAFTDGFMLRASEFANVAANWGISFALCNSSEDKGKYNYAIATFDKGKITATDFKVIYNLSKESRCSDWVRDKTEHELTKDRCYLSNALGTYHKEGYKGTVADDTFLGGFFTNANCVEKNNQFVALTSVMMGDTNAINLTTLNFKRCITYFAARRLITGPYATWINWQDEYMIPNTEHPDYKRFEADSIVYSLFNAKSNQSSLRDIEYNSKKWNIKNEFFWLSSDTMLALARAASPMNKDVEQDVNLFTGERYVYTLLQQAEVQANLSDTAKAVLAAATKLVIDSFKYRQDFAFIHPEYHINTWDAGWYQIKGILKEYMPDELKQFSELYKQFGDELRPLVYELGFLYK